MSNRPGDDSPSESKNRIFFALQHLLIASTVFETLPVMSSSELSLLTVTYIVLRVNFGELDFETCAIIPRAIRMECTT